MAETGKFNTTSIADNTSNLIEYSAGLTTGFSGAEVLDTETEYMRTKHGAQTAGPTAKFNFTVKSGVHMYIIRFSSPSTDAQSNSHVFTTATSIAVYGSLGSVDVYGIPVSSYAIDELHAATYTAPIILPGGFETNVFFHQSPTLASRLHEL